MMINQSNSFFLSTEIQDGAQMCYTLLQREDWYGLLWFGVVRFESVMVNVWHGMDSMLWLGWFG